jgi:hypothetical protein
MIAKLDILVVSKDKFTRDIFDGEEKEFHSSIVADSVSFGEDIEPKRNTSPSKGAVYEFVHHCNIDWSRHLERFQCHYLDDSPFVTSFFFVQTIHSQHPHQHHV